MSYNKDNPESIQELFGSIAKDYDRTNALMSFQMHRYWNRRLILATLEANSQRPVRSYADLCSGTGVIACGWLQRATSHQKAYLIDFCQEMLHCAKEKAANLQLTDKHEIIYVQADVQKLPLLNESIDRMTMAYGIRNVKEPLFCFKEAYRTLTSQGVLGILELTEPKNLLLRTAHSIYLKQVLPIIGKMVTSNRQAYEYLSRSIGAFTKPDELALQLQQVGFKEITIKPITGGIATLILARKG